MSDRLNAWHYFTGKLRGYGLGLQIGYTMGYDARCQEEAQAWQSESSARVFVDGQFWERPTAAEQRRERERILIEGHRAGLHEAINRGQICPLCRPCPDCSGALGSNDRAGCEACAAYVVEGITP
jgi:hypothetical protein